ncbi:MAG: TlpA family protein disulfide reductase [Nitrospirae bacterium]|nr:TlpA family protein disulfide reductase [Nitrospirota bacterium]
MTCPPGPGGSGVAGFVPMRALLLMGLLLAAATARAEPPAAFGMVAVPEPAPAFTLEDLAGHQTGLADFTGRVVVVNFWATWCVPCREEMPHLESLWRTYRDRGLVVVGVSEDRGGAKRVRKDVARMGLTFPVLLDPKGEVGRAYRVTGLPATALIGRDGRLAARVIGYRDWTGPDATGLVRHLLEAPGGNGTGPATASAPDGLGR